MRSSTRKPWSLLLVALVVSGIAWMSGAQPQASDAGGPHDARLLVKCGSGDVEKVGARLHGLDLELWDMETMRRLHVPAAAPAAPAAAAVPAAQIPALGDAVKMMNEIYDTVAAVGPEAGGTPIIISEMSIQDRRTAFKFLFREPGTPDKVRAALQKSAWFQANTEPLQAGSQQRLVSGEMRTAFSVKRRPTKGSRVATPGSTLGIPLTDIQRAALTAQMMMIYASAEQDDPNRRLGYRTVSREFTFNPATLGQFKTLVHQLSNLPSQLTVYELRWKLADAKARAEQADAIGKSVVKIGIRAPLGAR